MLRLTKGQRELLAQKVGDLANLAMAALVFGQAVSQDMFSLGIALVGTAIWSVLMAFTLALKGGSR